MKTKSNYVIRKALNSWIAFPLSHDQASQSCALTLNETGVMLWQHLEKGCTQDDLVQALVAEYNISQEHALADAAEFVANLQQLGCLEQENGTV